MEGFCAAAMYVTACMRARRARAFAVLMTGWMDADRRTAMSQYNMYDKGFVVISAARARAAILPHMRTLYMMMMMMCVLNMASGSYIPARWRFLYGGATWYMNLEFARAANVGAHARLTLRVAIVDCSSSCLPFCLLQQRSSAHAGRVYKYRQHGNNIFLAYM